MVTQTLYMTPEDFWRHAAPPSLLFGDADQGIEGIDEGSITAPVFVSGTGGGLITAGGIPRGAWTVQIKCVVAGEVNDANTLNPSATLLPAFEFSKDLGVTWLRAETVSAHRDFAIIEVAKLGMRFTFSNGAAPSFVVNDLWSCDTTPSEDITAGIPTVCARMDKFLVGSFDLPLTEFPADFTEVAADLLRWKLLKKIGVAEKQDLQVYKPVESWEWLKAAQVGDFVKPKDSLGITETGGGTSVQTFDPMPQPNPLCHELPI